MSGFLGSLFNSDSIKKQALNMFVKQFKSQGVKQVLLSLDEKDEVQMDIIDNDKILVSKTTHEFLLKFYNENKNK